jgi:hypothetical protein
VKLLIALVVTIAMAASCGSQQTGGAGSGGGSPGSSGSGDGVVSHDLPPGSQTLKAIKATPVKPHRGPGATPVSPLRIRTGVQGGAAFADIFWWGGLEDCYPLRPVTVQRDGDLITLRLFEGTGDGQACADLALLKTTRVDLGRLPAGSYTVVAGSRRAPLTVGQG